MQRGQVIVTQVASKNNIIDLFTNPLIAKVVEGHLMSLGLRVMQSRASGRKCDIIRNQYKGNKTRITLLIEYLKARTLFEIRITPQARSIMSSLNDSC